MKDARPLFALLLFFTIGAAWSTHRYGYDDDVSLFLIVAFVAALGVVGFYYYKKWSRK